MVISIDINCDVGEGVGNESDIFPLISSCNIACGGHAGDSNTMTEMIELAKKYNLKIGAHPSYPDRENFGRVSLQMDEATFIEAVRVQLQDFKDIVSSSGCKWHHIKAHGALYNDLAKSTELSETYIKAITPFLNGLKLYVPGGSAIADVAKENEIPVVLEGFADRNYNDDLTLVSRSLPNALIQDPFEVKQHILTMVRSAKVSTVQGNEVPIEVETFCIHGDTPSALQILTYLVAELPREHIEIAK